MTKKDILKPVTIAVGSALASSMIASTASADSSPFAMTALSTGYMHSLRSIQTRRRSTASRD